MEKSNKKFNINILLIILIAVFLVVLGVEIFMFATGSSNNVAQNEEESDTVKVKNNKMLKRNLTTIITALNNYQANNRGKIPSGTGDKNGSWDRFVEQYILIDGDEDEMAKYSFVYCEDFSSGSCKKSSDLNYENDKNIIYISVKATCDGSEVVSSTGSRKTAVYAIGQKTINMSKNPVYCMNN